MISAHALSIAPDDWFGRDVRMILLKDSHTLTPDRALPFLDDLNLATNEVDASGYDRTACTIVAASWDAGAEKWLFPVDDTVTDAITGADGYAGVVFYEHVTDDTDSLWLRITEDLDAVDFDGGAVTVGAVALWRTGQDD